MTSASRCASRVISTRKAILDAQIFQKLLSRTRMTSLYVFVALPDGLNGVLTVFLFPFQLCSEQMVQRFRDGLAM